MSLEGFFLTYPIHSVEECMSFFQQMCFLARRAEQGNADSVQEADVEFDFPSREREARDLSRGKINMWMGQVRVSSTNFITLHSCFTLVCCLQNQHTPSIS